MEKCYDRQKRVGKYNFRISLSWKKINRLFCFHFSISNGKILGLSFVFGLYKLNVLFEFIKLF